MKHKDCKHPNRICRWTEGINNFNPDTPQLCDYCKDNKTENLKNNKL